MNPKDNLGMMAGQPKGSDNVSQIMDMVKQLSPEELQQMISMMQDMVKGQAGNNPMMGQ